MAKKPIRKKKSGKKLTADKKKFKREQRSHAKLVRDTFSNAGFKRCISISDKEFTYEKITSDFDDVFIYENIIVFAEYTIAENHISEHLKKKNFLYEKIQEDSGKFIDFLRSFKSEFTNLLGDKYSNNKLEIRFLYASRKDINPDTKDTIKGVHFFDIPIAMYFKALTNNIKLSSREELLNYLEVSHEKVGKNVLSGQNEESSNFRGMLLPPDHSNYGPGFKILTFYVAPNALLERAYVLRKAGWHDNQAVYQRMIVSSKIKSIRRFVAKNKKVFLNNIVVTLDPSTKIVDENNDTENLESISETRPVNIQLPKKFNSIGIIDGQHRVFAYHEGGEDDEIVSKLRETVNLLVTGIIYPNDFPEHEKIRFEAELFLEINSTQSGAASELKQDILTITNPNSADAI